MSDTPSLEPIQPDGGPGNQSGNGRIHSPDGGPEAVQPEPVLPGDAGPNDASTRAHEAAAPTEFVEPARTIVAGEPGFLLHDQAPEAPPEPIVQEPEAARPAALPATRLRIDHVPSVGHCYAGEPITLHTRVQVLEQVQGLLVLVEAPRWLRVLEVESPPEATIYALQVGESRDELRWEVPGALAAGTVLHFETTLVAPQVDHLTHASPVHDDAALEIISHATALSLGGYDGSDVQVGQTAVVALRRKGSYLKYLPAVYERDPFMGRFLMLFESFWGPIDGQISALSEYFDPMVTTLPMLKWLADRLDLKVDDELPVAVIRRLVAKAVPLYRRRGTRSGLQELLEIYTGGEVRIVERRANNLRLGSNARLGQGVALGVRNQPHTFTLHIKLPPIPDDPMAPLVSERQRERRRARIRALIELEKPAHVTYTLDVDED